MKIKTMGPLAIVLALCMILTLTACGDSTVPESATPPSGWPGAYINAINNLVEKHGEGRMIPDGDGSSWYFFGGVGVVRLIDFNDDGIPELYVAFSDGSVQWLNKQVIYGWRSDALVVLMEECDVSNFGTDVSPYVTYIIKGGTAYLLNENGNDRESSIITLQFSQSTQNWEMVSVMDFYCPVWSDDYILNGKAATHDEIQAAVNEYKDGSEIVSISFVGRADPFELTKTRETIAVLQLYK